MADQQQSNIIQENNVATTGLNMDQTVNQVQKGQLTYALNAAVENFDSNSVNYQNEPGNELCLNFPADYHLIGTHFINEQNKHIFFLTNPTTGASEIGYMDNNDCVYRTYINAPCLNFNIDYPIHKAVHKITNCTTEVYWTDGLNPRRYIDLTNLPYLTIPGQNVCENVQTQEIDCNKLKIQPNFSIPQVDVIDVVNGGNLIAGTYQFAVQYCDVAGDAYTSYYSVTNPTPIGNPQITTPDFDYPVGKSIEVNITNLDTTGYFQYYNIAVIKTVNAITSVELIGTYFIDNPTRSITYNGQNQTQIRLTIDDIFERFPYYDVAQDITAVQDVLVWDNLTSIDQINYQKIASQITLNWETWRIPADENYADEINATNLRGYMRDEIYPFEIVFLLRNGKQTDGFHIPGRTISPLELSFPDVPDTNPDFIGQPDYTSGGIGYSAYWKIYNTGSVTGFSPGYSSSSDYKGAYQFGEFAYWESEETYPCNEVVWGDLAGKPIRHHKFPDLRVSPIFETGIYTTTGPFSPVETENAIFPIGVRINPQQIEQLIITSDLTADQKADIVGFKIVRGDRSTNKSIVAKGILRNVGKYTREETDYYFPNYPYNDIKPDPFLLTKSGAFVGQCDSYRITVTVNGNYNYTDCYTGDLVTGVEMTAGDVLTVCSITQPVITSGTATVLKTSWYKYQITSLSVSNTWFWRDPVTLAVNSWIVAPGQTITVDSTVPPNPIPGLAGTWTRVTVGNLNNPICAGSDLDAYSSNESKYRHVFNSPDTSFGSPFLGNVLKLENVMFGAGRAHFVEVKNNAMYKLLTKEAQEDALKSSADVANITGTFDPSAMFVAYQSYLQIYINGITRKNYGYSFNSIAEYDYWNNIDNNIGVKQRELDIYQYLIPGVQNVGDLHNINNYERESSVYLRTDISKTPLPFPEQTPSMVLSSGGSLVVDNSRFVISEKDNCLTPEKEESINVVGYYASIKNIIPNQWGQMYSYNTIDTGTQVIVDPTTSSDALTVFGGDTFINKFSFKTKLPFFIDNRVNAPDDSDVFYDEIGNVAYPKYWHSARSILSDYVVPSGTPNPIMKNIISYKAHNFDCPNSQENTPGNVGRTFYDGKMYMFAYGIPTFFCESSVNVDLRQAYNNREGDFYPHVSTGIPDNWFQESFVSIAFDNTYYYNATFSKQNRETSVTHLPVNYDGNPCYTNFPFRAIYSDRQQSFTDNRINSWLIYRPVSFFDFPQNYGKLTSLDGIQNRAVLARFENKSLLYNTLLTIDTSNPQAAYIGNDTLFRSAPPIDFAETDLGYVGSQNKMLLKIPQGQITVDAKRGQIFLISGNGAQDLSGFGSGLNRFFTDHLAFEILRYFNNVPTDNHFNGVGLHGVYDSKYDRVIISKLDYIPLDSKIKYDANTNDFYIDRVYDELVVREVVYLTDPEYFCNKSWTLSFNFNTKTWVSFHSYIPNWYIAENNFFYSGLNGGCDLELIAAQEVPTPSTTSTSTTIKPPEPTTTTTTTTPPDCDLEGEADLLDCSLEGDAEVIYTTTTTTTALDCELAGSAQEV
jgi:hypothetical protein